jgi:hypothetical protein
MFKCLAVFAGQLLLSQCVFCGEEEIAKIKPVAEVAQAVAVQKGNANNGSASVEKASVNHVATGYSSSTRSSSSQEICNCADQHCSAVFATPLAYMQGRVRTCLHKI